MAYCVKCGTQLSDGANFCPECGNPCGNTSSQSAEVGIAKQKKSSKVTSKALLAVFLVLAVIIGGWFLWSRVSPSKYSLESLAQTIPNYDYVENFHDGIAIGHKGDKCGYFNMQGEVITPCIYEEAISSSEGLARVKKDGKWGFINSTGKEVIPCMYDDALDFSEGLVLVQKDGNYGFIDYEGNNVIPFIYGYSHSFSEGLAAVSTENGYQYIDKTGKTIITCNWDNGAYWDFHNGLAPRMDDDGEYYGYIDKTGKMVIPASFYPYKGEMGLFKDGFAIVTRAGNEKSEVIDVNGKNVLGFDFDGYARYNDEVIMICSNEEVSFYNTKGQKIVEKSYKDATPFSEGLASVTDGEYWGYIDKTGKTIIPATFDWAGEFSEGLAVIKKNGVYGYIDKDGNSMFNVTNEERTTTEEDKIETESEEFCKRFSLEDLLCLLRNYENPNKAESSGLSFIYKDVTKEEYGDDITIVYGKYIEKDGKNQLTSTTTHSCFFQVLLDTSTQYRMNFSNKDDANSFFKKVLDYGVIKHENYYYIPRKKLPGGKTITVSSIDWSSDDAPIYSIEPPKVIEGFYSLIIGDVY